MQFHEYVRDTPDGPTVAARGTREDGATVFLDWGGYGHTVNAWIDGAEVGVCSIGTFADNDADEADFLDLLTEFAEDPYEHPVVTG